MLTLPDFKEKKIIFISHNGEDPNELKFTNSNLRLYKNKKFINQITYHLIFCIFIVGNTTITSKVIQEASKRGISIFFLDDSLKTYAEMIAGAEGNTSLRKKQYTLSEKDEFAIAKILVCNKIKSQSTVIKQYGTGKLLNRKKAYLNSIDSIDKFDDLLGIEGNFAKEYFSDIFKEMDWNRRAPRSRQDIENFLLDIGYTFLLNYTDSLLRLFGFDTYKGIYHKLFFQRKSLTCDVMEPLRPLIDKQLIKSYNLGQIDSKDFKFRNGEFEFKDYEARKKYTNILLQTLMDNRNEIYTYILGFYRFFMNSDKYPYKEFKIK